MRLHIAINLSESANTRLAKLCQKAEPDMSRQHELVLARIKHPDIAAAKAALDTLDFDPLDISIDRIVTGSGDNDDVFCACTAPNPRCAR